MVKAGKIKNPVAKTLDYYHIMRDEMGEYIINLSLTPRPSHTPSNPAYTTTTRKQTSPPTGWKMGKATVVGKQSLHNGKIRMRCQKS